jgi:4-alpha-glucanotransferase
LGRSRAPIVLATLEDLWLETEPQNIPGSEHQDEAFRRSAAHGIDELDGLTSVTGAIDRLVQARRSTT